MGIREWIGFVLATLIVISAVPYFSSRGVRQAMRRRSRKNMGSAAGLDAAVIGATSMCLGLISAFSAKLISATGLTATLLNAALVVGAFGGLFFCIVMVTASLYGRPSWVIRESEDLWIRDFRRREVARRESTKSDDSNHEHRQDRLMRRRDKPISGVDEMLAEIDRKLSDGSMSLTEHDDWQRKLLELKRPVQWELAWPISLGITIGLILVAVLVIYLVNQP